MIAVMDLTFLMLICTLALPLISFLWLCLPVTATRKPYLHVAGILNGLAGLSSLVYFLSSGSRLYRYASWEWIKVKAWNLQFGLVHYPETAFLVFTVSLLSLFVWIYSLAYLDSKEDRHRYFRHLSLFIFGMQWLLVAPGLGQFFMGWELIGIASYLLIGFYRETPDEASAASSAFMHNRVGDLGLLTAVSILLLAGGTADFTALSDLANEGMYAESLLVVAGFGFVIASMAKSAQFPLHAWLPAAMAGPTPISALIHAATLVVSGIVLLLRIKPLLLPMHLDLLYGIAGLTALMAAVMALFQTDLKKLLAWSTISQLGWLIMAFSKGGEYASLQHLYAHAYFKSGLFLLAGIFILFAQHAELNEPGSIRGLKPWLLNHKVLRWSGIVLLCALSGFPLTAAFLSKEQILMGFAASSQTWSDPLYWISFLVPLLTAAYAARLYFTVFHTGSEELLLGKSWKATASLWMIPLLLALLSIFPLLSLNPFAGTENWGPVLGFGFYPAGNPIPASTQWLLISLALTLSGWIVGFLLFRFNLQLPFLNRRYWTEHLQAGLVRPVFAAGRGFSFADRRILDAGIETLSRSVVVLAHVFKLVDRHLIDGGLRLFNKALYHAGPWGATTSEGKLQGYLARTALVLMVLVGLVMMYLD
jgi:NADH-quinone oxidoreductase subunit L